MIALRTGAHPYNVHGLDDPAERLARATDQLRDGINYARVAIEIDSILDESGARPVIDTRNRIMAAITRGDDE